jgi:hypothetical protein
MLLRLTLQRQDCVFVLAGPHAQTDTKSAGGNCRRRKINRQTLRGRSSRLSRPTDRRHAAPHAGWPSQRDGRVLRAHSGSEEAGVKPERALFP